MKGAKPMRALFVIDNLAVSGAEKIAINVVKRAKELGLPWDGLVFMDNRVDASGLSLELLSFAEQGSQSENLLARLAKAFKRSLSLRRISKGYDVVVPVTPVMLPFAWLACIGSRPALAQWVHYDWLGFGQEPLTPGRKARDALIKWVYLRLAPRCKNMVFISEGSKSSFAKFERPSSNWLTIRNAYDRTPLLSDRESTSASSLQADRRDGKVPLLFLGRVANQKRSEWAIEVMEALEVKRPGAFTLHMVGDGPEMDMLKSRVNRSPAKEAVRIHGFDWCPPKAMQACSGLLLTSRHEAWPTVILEAFDARRPVFSIDCPSGPSEMLGHQGERGRLSKDPQQMAGQINEWFFLTSPERQSATLDAAHAMVEGLEREGIMEQWERAFDSFAKGKKGEQS